MTENKAKYRHFFYKKVFGNNETNNGVSNKTLSEIGLAPADPGCNLCSCVLDLMSIG